MQKLGMYVGLGGYTETFEERLKLIKEAGFNIVCLNFEKEMEKTETSWKNQVELVHKYSLPVQAAHLTGSGMTSIWTDGEMADFVTRRLIDELKMMKQVDVPVGVAHITWGFEKPLAPSQNALKRFEKITEAAEKYGVCLALENSVYAEHVHFVLDNIKSPNLGFCYDSGHENAFTPNENYLAKYKDRLLAMHLHDNIGSYDNHFPPFHKEGTIDWNNKVNLLKQTKLFNESIILEVGAQKEDIRELIKISYDAAVRLANM